MQMSFMWRTGIVILLFLASPVLMNARAGAQTNCYFLECDSPKAAPQPAPAAAPSPATPSSPAVATAAGPAFNCRFAKSTDEIAVCNSGTLSALDRQLNTAYNALIASLTTDQQKRLSQEENNWRQLRLGCRGSVSCLTTAYELRIQQLQNWR
jgi:hypothetical protein